MDGHSCTLDLLAANWTLNAALQDTGWGGRQGRTHVHWRLDGWVLVWCGGPPRPEPLPSPSAPCSKHATFCCSCQGSCGSHQRTRQSARKQTSRPIHADGLMAISDINCSTPHPRFPILCSSQPSHATVHIQPFFTAAPPFVFLSRQPTWPLPPE